MQTLSKTILRQTNRSTLKTVGMDRLQKVPYAVYIYRLQKELEAIGVANWNLCDTHSFRGKNMSMGCGRILQDPQHVTNR